MGFHVFDDSQNAAGWLLSIIFAPICIVATVLRFVATKRSGRKLGLEDFWALLGLVFFLPYVVYMLMCMVIDLTSLAKVSGSRLMLISF